MTATAFNIMMTIRSDVAAAKAGLADVATGLKAVSTEAGKTSVATKKEAADLDALAAAAGKAAMAQDDLAAAQRRSASQPVNVLSNNSQAGAAVIGTWRGAETAASSLRSAVAGLNVTIGGQAHEFIESAAASARYQAALDDIRASFNPLFAASMQYERQLERIAEAERIGAISAREAAAARDSAAASMAPSLSVPGVGGGSPGSAYTANVAAQGFDIGVTAAMGMNPAMIGLQQGTQLVQVMQQMGGGKTALMGIASGFLSILNPMSLATIGITAFGAFAIQWLMKIIPATKSVEEVLGDLSDGVGRLGDASKASRRSMLDLAAEFGTTAKDAQGLLDLMVEIEKRSAGRQANDAIGAIYSGLGGGWSRYGYEAGSAAYLMRMFDEGSLLGSLMPNEKDSPLSHNVLGALGNLDQARKSGDIESQISAVTGLMTAVNEAANAYGGLTKEEEGWLRQIKDLGLELSRVKALGENAAGKAEAESMRAEIVRQVDLQRAALAYGEDSAEVTAVRARHEREIAEEKLKALGIDLGSREAARVLNGLIESRGLAEKQAASERGSWARDQDDRIVGIQREISLIGATASEQARVNALAEAELEIRDRNLTALEAAEARVKAIARAEEEARLARAKAEYDLQVTTMMGGYDARIAGETNPYARAALEGEREYARRVANGEDADIAAAYAALTRADALREVTQAQSEYLRDQDRATEQLRMELALMGQSAEVRARVLAMVQAEQDIQRLGASGDRAEQIRSSALAQQELTTAIEAQADAWQRVQSAGEGAIDGVLNALRAGDVKGAMAGLLGEIEKGFFDLSIRNPLKNAILGTNLGTWDDVGGWGGVIGRFTGRNTVDEAEVVKAATASMTTPSMTVTAANVTLAGNLSGLAPQLLGAANTDRAPMIGGLSGGLAGSGDVQSQIWQFFAGKGLAAHQIAGIMGNASAESGFNPLAVGDGGNAHGLFQWNDRRHRLFDAIGGQQNLGDVQKQLEFAWQELMTSEAAAMRRLMASTDVRGATDAFLGFERPQGYSVANPEASHNYVGRLSAAEAALAKFGTATTTAGDRVSSLGPAAASAGQNLERTAAGAAAASQGVGIFGGLLSGLGGIVGAATGGVGGSAISLVANAGAQLLGGARLFREGGYTGDGSPDDAAGVVHAGEFVFTAATTRRIGVRNLEAIQSGAMRGFREGGYVTAGRGPALPPDAAARQVSGAPRDQRAVFEINVSGTGDTQIAAGVQAAITQAFDQYDRDVFAGRVRMVLNDRWG